MSFSILGVLEDVWRPFARASGVAASRYTVVAPSHLRIGDAAQFTVAPDGRATATVTMSDGGAGGTFTPTTLSWTNQSQSQTFTYTPASLSPVTISFSDDVGLSDPDPVVLDVLPPLHRTVADGNWSEPTNWDTGSSPGLHDVALVRHSIVLDADTDVGEPTLVGVPALALSSGGHLVLPAGRVLTLHGGWRNGGLVTLGHGARIAAGSDVTVNLRGSGSGTARRGLVALGR